MRWKKSAAVVAGLASLVTATPAFAEPHPSDHAAAAAKDRGERGAEVARKKGERRGDEHDRGKGRPDTRGAQGRKAPDEAGFRRAEDQRRDEERRDRDARRGDRDAWNQGRAERAKTHRDEILASWGAAANTKEGREELARHGDVMARLNRVLDVAKDRHDDAMIARANELIQRESARHAKAFAEIMKETAR